MLFRQVLYELIIVQRELFNVNYLT